MAVSQVAVELAFLLVVRSAGVMALESGFSTLGIVAGGLIVAVSALSFELPPVL